MILVFNSGSSSLKFKLYGIDAGEALQTGAVVRFGAEARWTWQRGGDTDHGQAALHNHREAARWALRRMRAQAAQILAVGHRVVHGGDEFRQPTRLTPATIARLEHLSMLAPLHNPLALEVIAACREVLGSAVPMVAVFDTAFHAALPEPARRYALPPEWTQAHAIRRYGFHGIAHRYMYERFLALSGRATARAVAFQLGNGCSVSAIRDGISIETSMGYTPLEGLIMATRSGDVDPGVLVRLMSKGVTAAELEQKLNHASGLLALSGASGDMRKLLALMEQGHAGARLAIDAFCHRARKYLGAYLAVLGGSDAVLFGGGIGEHAPEIRARICAGMEWCGLRLADAENASGAPERRLSPPGAAPEVYVIAVDEEILIAREVRECLDALGHSWP